MLWSFFCEFLMAIKIEVGYGSHSYGYAESDEDTIYCSGPQRHIIKLLVEGMVSPDDSDAAGFLEDLPSRLHGRIWARTIEHYPGKHDQSAHGNKYGTDADGNRVLTRKGGSKKSSFDSSKFDNMSTDDKGEFLDKNGGEEWRESLTADEEKAIQIYTGGGFIRMNRMLRTGEPDETHQDFFEKKIADATSALMRSKAPCDMTVFRDIGSGQAKYLEGNEGSTYHQKGFSSTTVDSDPDGVGFKRQDGIRMYIKVPKGTPGAYVEKGELGANGEHEWLIPPNSKYRIDKVSKKGEGREVHLTYLGAGKQHN